MTTAPEYVVHDGGDCPVDEDAFVDCIIRTSQKDGDDHLLGHSGVGRASMHEWNADTHPGGVGAIVAWRHAEQGEEVNVYERWPEGSTPG